MRAKILFLGGLALVVSSGVRAQDRPNRATATPMPAVERPRDIPKKLEPYFVALLVKGPKPVEPNTPEHKKVFRGHLAHIRAMIKQLHPAMLAIARARGRPVLTTA
jgi:hypothetical protein